MTPHPGEGWKDDDADGNNWQEAYSRLDWKAQQEIQKIAKQHSLTTVEAMKRRFKHNIAVAMSGQMPKDWTLYSPAELAALQKTQQDEAFLKELAKLMEECDVNPASIQVGEDEELRNWKGGKGKGEK